MLNRATYLPKLKEFEGAIPFLYLDTGGNVTVGVGNLLANAAAAQKLAFVRRDPPCAAATAAEIQTDFDNVDKQASGKLAGFYKQFTKLDLPDAVIDSLLAARVTEFQTLLTASFPDFLLYPDAACAALFDMGFNLGVGKLTSSFPTFVKAVKAKDWPTASKECHRNGINKDRNDWTKAQFDSLISK